MTLLFYLHVKPSSQWHKCYRDGDNGFD